ncbi:hypothetical protein S4054249_10245 [Pseudoalteromonas luteoviolacea]|nr:hypothetical protein [Pseudoalteromonas luteoviolacea]AOT08200.1 hypothetical protein S4054249_10245 [Pseudoalteromonas luteoviolacea]AOT13117.1 hypothetical protein S40542_10245 [Pseudoalteromonas luteoviolacea]AOT18029.1 hypothetical protein S4054_10240 [Pseudoalteromonas luteoviolacea]
MSQTDKIQPHWWSKTFAGIFAGFFLSLGLVGIFAWIGPTGLTEQITAEQRSWKTQFNMWMITPIWCLILSFVYLFKTGKQAWIYLGGGAVLSIAVVYALRSYL